MTRQTQEVGSFPEQFRNSMRRKPPPFTTARVLKNEKVYAEGDRAEAVYFIESGHIKLHTLSPEGKECLLSIHGEADTFGESCLAASAPRRETATAMHDTTLKVIPAAAFFAYLGDNDLFKSFVLYLAARIAEQQRTITHLITVNSEQRLGETLLELARKLGKQDPQSKRIEQRITHEELSQMVGTTRPRVTAFMLKFRGLGLVTVSPERFLIVHETKLADYLAEMA